MGKVRKTLLTLKLGDLGLTPNASLSGRSHVGSRVDPLLVLKSTCSSDVSRYLGLTVRSFPTHLQSSEPEAVLEVP